MRYKIMIVDVDHIALFLHQTVISDFGVKNDPESFSSALQLLDRLETDHEADTEYLIMLDINMPVKNGWSLLEDLTAHPLFSKMYVVMVSSSVEPSDQQRAFSYKIVSDFIIKPLNEDQLARIKNIKNLEPFFTN